MCVRGTVVRRIAATAKCPESAELEPGAASPSDRAKALRLAHSLGIRTWVSLEPVIDPDEALAIIQLTYTYVDKFKVGKMNYNAAGKLVDWATFGRKAEKLLQRLNQDYYIKHDLRECMDA